MDMPHMQTKTFQVRSSASTEEKGCQKKIKHMPFIVIWSNPFKSSEKKEKEIMNSEKHPGTIGRGYDGTLDMLAEDISNLHYEAFHEFLTALAANIHEDAKRDVERKRGKLALQLFNASLGISDAAEHIGKAWKISKPYMKE